jgi:hypothetical protein
MPFPTPSTPVLSFANLATFPVTGNASVTYIALDTTFQYIWTGATYLLLAGAVNSVNTRTGSVVITKTDVGLGNCDNTSDVNKPVSTAQATADGLNLKIASNLADLANITTAKTNLSLQNIDNTSDVNKPISTATQTALDLKQPILAPTVATSVDYTTLATDHFVEITVTGKIVTLITAIGRTGKIQIIDNSALGTSYVIAGGITLPLTSQSSLSFRSNGTIWRIF